MVMISSDPTHDPTGYPIQVESLDHIITMGYQWYQPTVDICWYGDDNQPLGPLGSGKGRQRKPWFLPSKYCGVHGTNQLWELDLKGHLREKLLLGSCPQHDELTLGRNIKVVPPLWIALISHAVLEGDRTTANRDAHIFRPLWVFEETAWSTAVVWM